MSHFIHKLHKEFDNRVRLGIMSILIVNEWVEFTEIKRLLELTDGNLASHISGLEKAQCIEYKKEFVGRRPKTSYRVTPIGRMMFEEHLAALESLLKKK